MTTSTNNEITIDATGRSIGRVASEAAVILRGKNSPAFERHLLPTTRVHITNAKALRISEKKAGEKIYTHYTGHPGGLRQVPLARVLAKKGYGEPLKKAIYGMLPNNKLRRQIMKHLTISE